MPTARGKFKTQRSVVDAHGISISREFVQRKGESERAVVQRANKWQVENRGKAPSPTMTLERAVQIYLEYRKADLDEGLIQPPTYRADQTDSKNLVEALGAQTIDRIDAYGIDMATKALSSTPRTAKGMREFGRKLYKWLIARHWAERNPFMDSRPVSYEPDKWQEPMTAEEFEEALAKVEQADIRTMLATLRWTGLRPKGVRELLWSELEEKDGRLFIRKQTAKRTSGKRPVFVPKVAADMIREMPRTSLFVFPSPKTGKPYAETHVAKIWRGVRPNDRGVYDLKHLRVTELAEFGLDPEKTVAAVGMKSTQSLQHYRQISASKLAMEIENVGTQVGTSKRKRKNSG
jgi:integrase